MKSLFSTCFLALTIFCSLQAQVLEQYFDSKEVYRFATPTAGAKYIYYDFSTNEIVLLNPDFSTYKSFVVSGLPDSIEYIVTGIYSENQFNNDPLIEFYIAYITPDDVFYRIMNENGATLYGDYSSFMRVVEINGERKLVHENKIYALPGFQLEHTFLNPVNFFSLDNGNVKFYENSPDSVIFYNDDYTYWKTIFIEDNLVCSPFSKYGYSDNFFNDDSAIEFIVASFCDDFTNSYSTLEVRDETDATLFSDTSSSFSGTGLMLPASLTGQSENRFGVESFDTLDIYRLPDFVHEKTFIGKGFSRLDESGFKYFDQSFNSDTAGNVQLYNTDYSLWKTVPKQAGYFFNNLHYSEKIIDNDPDLEVMGFYSLATNPLEHGIRILNENGNVAFSVEGPEFSFLDTWQGHPNKLFCIRSHMDDFYQFDTWVYALPTSTSPVIEMSELAFSVTAAPNPFSGSFSIQTEGISNTWDAKIQIFNVLGESMPFFRQDGEQNIHIQNIAHWPAGIYMAVIQVGNQRTNVKLVKK